MVIIGRNFILSFTKRSFYWAGEMVLWIKDSHSSVRNDVWIPRTWVTLLGSQHSEVEARFLAQAYLARLSGSVSSSFS